MFFDNVNVLCSLSVPGLAKSLARRPGAIVFSSRATKIWQRMNLHFQKAYLMFRSMPNCAYRPMLLRSKHIEL